MYVCCHIVPALRFRESNLWSTPIRDLGLTIQGIRLEWGVPFETVAIAEEYRPEPFSRRYVRHLPGWYAPKHPDEDWAETFAVWMTPGFDWRAEYGAGRSPTPNSPTAAAR